MKKVEIKTKITVFDSLEELSSSAKNLMNKAIEAKKSAYAPYSKFKVGAAFLLEDGTIVTGNNQENAAYPSGMCAERVAIWKVSSEYPHLKILKLAITASSSAQITREPVAPCGACRQTLSEYELKQKDEIEVYFMGEVGKVIKTDSLLDLLPIAFDKSFL
ncbi:MAG: cytidine deaminase [Lutibacter sp.]|uniref:cytidine deaminase n=1 Tax=Lutibacter sp. TaxID=1925666 RepID=UPI0018419C11|nr:cytidine deaminase [Lutibacter sp.]MBT8316575.1 cytidine deaminase [Lutibacter sp.]NNJ57435.1 cytidine deaminase [Lutibacter sp.]